MDENDIKGTIALRATQLLLKYIQVPELRERLPEILVLLGKLSAQERVTEYLQVVLEYVFQATEHVDVQDVQEALKKIPQGENIMPTIAEKLREEGMQQGMIAEAREMVLEALAERSKRLAATRGAGSEHRRVQQSP